MVWRAFGGGHHDKHEGRSILWKTDIADWRSKTSLVANKRPPPLALAHSDHAAPTASTAGRPMRASVSQSPPLIPMPPTHSPSTTPETASSRGRSKAAEAVDLGRQVLSAARSEEVPYNALETVVRGTNHCAGAVRDHRLGLREPSRRTYENALLWLIAGAACCTRLTSMNFEGSLGFERGTPPCAPDESTLLSLSA